MRIKKAYTYNLRPAPEKTIGHFGPVSLVRKSNGLARLEGGSVKEQSTVRKWCRRFAGDIVAFENHTGMAMAA